jgi:hypothetical protein
MSGSHKTVDKALPPRLKGEKSLPYWEMLFRETIAIEMLAVLLVCMALMWNAPLERLADPQHTANPAKAPWYFTGLQELLHYFPPFVAGIILPTLIVLALVVVPFFNVNIKDETLWLHDKARRLTILGTHKHGLPTSLDDEVLVGLIQLTKRRSNFNDPRVQFSRYEFS